MKKIGLFLTAALFCIGTMTMMQSCSKPCKDDPCGANGACVEDGKDYTCTCETGYEGELCDVKMVTKFLGSYSATSGGGCSFGFQGNIAASTTVDQIVISDFGKWGCNNEYPSINATVNGTDLTIIDYSSSCSPDDWTVKGTGSINAAGTVITINYNGDNPPSGGGGTYSCTATLTLN